ncbi:MAG: TetR/AcrR family transcriptional regulator, partial [Mycobacterium sp.]
TIRGAEERAWLTESPIVARLATELNGLTDDDTEAGQWIVRVVLSLLYWPVDEAEVERQMIKRFISPAFAP